MKKKLIIVFAIGLSLSLASCSCFFNNSGTFHAINESQRGLTYTVVIDNINYGNVAPGEEKLFEDVPAGDRVVVFKIAGTSKMACQPAIVNIPRCGSRALSCSY